ncbi:MAG: DUF2180 family protein [Labedaea sp.]
MLCYDCARDGREEPAVGVCAAGSAGVCLACARVGSRSIHRMEGFVSAEVSTNDTRVINCPQCADAIHAHHPAEQGPRTLVPFTAKGAGHPADRRGGRWRRGGGWGRGSWRGSARC